MTELFYFDDYVKELEEIVNTDSGSADLEGCLQMTEHFQNRFCQEGFQTTSNREEGKNPYVEARYFGREGKDIDVLLMDIWTPYFQKGRLPKDRSVSKATAPLVLVWRI